MAQFNVIALLYEEMCVHGDSQWVVHVELWVNIIMPYVHVCANKDGQLIALLHKRQVIELERQLMLANTVHMCACVRLHRCWAHNFYLSSISASSSSSSSAQLQYGRTSSQRRRARIASDERSIGRHIRNSFRSNYVRSLIVSLYNGFMKLWICGPVCLLSLHRFLQ